MQLVDLLLVSFFTQQRPMHPRKYTVNKHWQIIAKKIKEQKQITRLTFLEQLKIAHQAQ